MHGVALEDRTLRRIIATLVASAVLAERAAGRSFPVRWLVLTILRSAESVALQFVLEATQIDWPCPDDDLETGSRPVDAALLGLRFRMLAAMLGALLRPTGRSDDTACVLRTARLFASGPCRLLAMSDVTTLQPHDTS